MNRGVSMTKITIIDIICQEYNETKSVKKVAERLNIPKSRVVKVLSTEGYILNYKHGQIMEMHQNDEPVEKIAEKVHLSVRTVKEYLPARQKRR